jgi:hypothetical protein
MLKVGFYTALESALCYTMEPTKIIVCAAAVIGVVISLGELNIAFILLVICVLAVLPSDWFRDKFWKD